MRVLRALITGIEGFVGPHLMSNLKDHGYEVIGTFLKDKPDQEGVFFKMDITDSKQCDELISKINPDYIFHLAGFSSVSKSWDFPDETFRINVDGTKNLMDSAIKLKNNPKILIVSSAEVYGIPESIPISENHRLNPINPYGKSRLAQEELCKEYVSKGMKIIISRSFNHLGPGQSELFVASDFAKQIAMIEKGLKLPIIFTGDLSIKRDFTDVRDVVNAYRLLLEKGFNHNREETKIFNICSGKSIKIQCLLDKLIELSNKDILVKEESNKIRNAEIPILKGNNSKIINKIGWNLKFDINHTLKEILDYWRKIVNSHKGRLKKTQQDI